MPAALLLLKKDFVENIISANRLDEKNQRSSSHCFFILYR